MAEQERRIEERGTDRSETGGMLSRLIRQLVLGILFGFTGIPALWRSTKLYGVFVLLLFVAALTLTLTIGWWYLFILVGLLWLADVLTMISRICIYARGMKHHKKNSEK